MSSAVIDKIREGLNRQDGISAETMSALAAAYGQEVETVNERLGVCIGLLRKGLRSEAIQQANIRPSLVDWCAKLDFPEIDEWYEILQFLQVKLPRSLNRDWVRQIQEALIEEQPLEEVLRRHRRLAIAKAPLAWRLRVLRRIAAIDSANPVWQEDIESWEKVRLREVGGELDRAIKEQNSELVSAIAAELSSNDWRIPPSPEFVLSAQQAADRFEYAANTVQLRSLAEQLNNEFCSQDEACCRALRERYQQVLQAMKGLVPAEIHELAEPALIWLEHRDIELLEHESHLQSVTDLENEIHRGGSVLHLQNAYSAATRSGREVDPSLERRYRAALSELQLMGRRKLVIRVTSIVLAAVLGLSAFGFWQWRSMQEREVANSAAALKQLIDEKKLAEAEQYLDNLRSSNARVANSVSVTALASDLEGRIKQESERKARFDEFIAQAENEDPSKIDLGALGNAERIAVDDSEKAVVSSIRRRRTKFDNELENKQLVELKAVLEEITTALDDIEKRDIRQVHEKDVDKLVQQLEEIRNQFGRTGTNGQALVDVVKKRANSLRTSIATSRANIQSELAALERLKSVDSLPALQLALTDFVTSAPKSLMAVEVQKVISETPIWQRIEDWNGVTLQATDYLNSKAPEKAAALTKSLNDINSKLKSNPALAELEAVRSHLDKVSRRKEILTELSNKLSRDIRIGLYTLVGTSRKSDPKQRYFAYSSTVDPLMERIKSGSVGLEVVTGSDGTVNREGFTGQITISKEPQKTFAFLAAQFKDNSAAVLRNWESEMLIRIGEVMKNAELDAAIKEMLIARILESACQGSNLLQDLQTNNLTMLQTRVSSNRTWHQATAPKVELDAEVMKQLRPSLSDTLAVVKKGQADILLEQISKKNMRFIGYVLKSDEGTPSARIVEAGDVSGFLIVLSGVDMNNTIASMAEVGKIRNGKVQLSGSASQLAAGRPLFLMPAVSTK